jgi:acetoin utilization protein AcuC
MKNLTITHHPQYQNWVFDPTHPTQGRRFIKGYEATIMHANENQVTHQTLTPRPATIKELMTVHTLDYINTVIRDHQSGEWTGKRPDMAALAQLFVGGTLTALDSLTSGQTLTAVHLPGAKHHAQADHASGFCVFNDFAIAAHTMNESGKRVAIFDLDAHHGDGVENLCAKMPNVLTYSVHEDGIFPGTGLDDDPKRHIFNWALPAYSGNRLLMMATGDFLYEAQAFRPDMLFITGGADGHRNDPLSSLRYTLNGVEESMRLIRKAFPHTPVLFGGAGGYDPDGATPLMWARMVRGLTA